MRALLTTALLLLSTPAFADETTNSIIAVRDTNGKRLRVGEHYYISSTFRGAAGGDLTLHFRHTSGCPYYVAQQSSDLQPGIPARFYPVNSNQTIIRTSTDLNVVFGFLAYCRRLAVWKMDLDTNNARRWYVGSSGTVGNPGIETVSNWFKIERHDPSRNAYKLVFCPSVCKSCRVPCGDLGILHGGGRFVGLSPDRNLTVVFKKVDERYSE